MVTGNSSSPCMLLPKPVRVTDQQWPSGVKPVVSICCITYNHEKFIGKAIDGFLMQETNFPIEIIIRDDCSLDNTAAIIKKYHERFPSIIKPVYETTNQYSKNVRPLAAIIKHAVGKYIALCEGDDYWTDKSKLQKQVEFLDMNGSYSICHHASSSVDQHDNLVKKNAMDVYKDYTKEELLTGKGDISTNTIIFRNIIDAEELCKFDIKKSPAGDAILFHLLGFHGKCKFLSNINPSAYRVHQGGVWTNRKIEKQVEDSINTYKAIRKNLRDSIGLNSELNKMINLRFSGLYDYWFVHYVYAYNFYGYFSCLRHLLRDSDLDRTCIYAYHLKHISRILFSKLKNLFEFKNNS